MSDGYWVMLQPLPPGEHVITFGGRFLADGFSQEVRYHLQWSSRGRAVNKENRSAVTGRARSGDRGFEVRTGGPVRRSGGRDGFLFKWR